MRRALLIASLMIAAAAIQQSAQPPRWIYWGPVSAATVMGYQAHRTVNKPSGLPDGLMFALHPSFGWGAYLRSR